MKIIVSFSGGKDSVAMLVKLIEEGIYFDEIIYVKDFFPYPSFIMEHYFTYIENTLHIKITKLDLDYKEHIKKNKLYPSKRIPLCSRLKAETQWRYLKQKYGRDESILFYIGTRKDESKQRENYEQEGEWYWNKRFRCKHRYYYPIFNFTEEMVFDFLNKMNIKLNPFYHILEVSRLGCSLCMNGSKAKTWSFFRAFPDDFNEFVEFEKEMKEAFPEKDIKMFSKYSISSLYEEFKRKLDNIPIKDVNECIKECPYLYPILKEKLDKLTIKDVVNTFVDVIKIHLPDDFYSLEHNIRLNKINNLFPKYINELSTTKRQILRYVLNKISECRKIEIINSVIKNTIQSFYNDKKVQDFLKKEMERIIIEQGLPEDYFQNEYLNQMKEIDKVIITLNENGFFKRRGFYS